MFSTTIYCKEDCWIGFSRLYSMFSIGLWFSPKLKQVDIVPLALDPKMIIVGSQRDEWIIVEAIVLFKEFAYAFSLSYLDLKGISSWYGELKIELHPRTKPIWKRPYRMNPKYKPKVEDVIHKSTIASIVYLVEFNEWVFPIVIAKKKNGKLCICDGSNSNKS